MDSSDEELFNAAPSYSRSIINTSSNLNEADLNEAMKQTNDLVQDPIKERDCNKYLMKDISIKIIRLSNKQIMNEQTNTHLVKNKKKRKLGMWKFGRYSKKKKTKKFSSQQTFKKGKPTTEVTMESLEDKIDDNTCAHLYEQSQKIQEESCVATQQDVQDVQDTQDAKDTQGNAESLILSTYEAQNEVEDLCTEIYVCARILPYKFHKKKNTVSSNNAIDAVACYNFLSSSSNSETIEKDSNTDKIYVSKCALSKNKEKLMKTLFQERLKGMSRKFATQEKLHEWKTKRKRSSSISSITSTSSMSSISSISFASQPRRKRCRRISSDVPSDDEITAESNIEISRDDNGNKSHLSHERMDQEKSRTNIQISHEACIILTRLEQMDDVDIIKWRTSRIKNALDIIESQLIEEQQLNKRKQATSKRRRNKKIQSNRCNLSEIEDIYEDLSQMSMVSSTRVEKHNPASSNDSLDMIKLRKKYKLFKKPKVLMIKLEALGISFENGKYSATEINRLTKKYINFIISSNSSSKPRDSSLFGLAHIRRKSTTDDNVTLTENNNTSYSLSGRQSVNKNFKQSDVDKSSIKGTTLSNFVLIHIGYFSLITKYYNSSVFSIIL